MALRRQIIDFIWLYLLNDTNQATGIGHVAIVQHEFTPRHVRVLVEVINAVGVKERGTALDAMHFVAFVQ